MAKLYYEKNGKKEYAYKKASRWLKLDYTVITPNHRLADYADKTEGKELWLTFFKFKGKQYALGQFMRLQYPIMIEDDDWKISVIGAYDCTQSYNPYFIEVHPDGECVRLWEEIKEEK